MATMRFGSNATSQLDAGASILAAARTADTRLIKGRVTAFQEAQRSYAAAHEKVHAAEAQVDAARLRLGELNVDQDEAVSALAAALIVDGERRTNAFAAFGGPAPSRLIALPPPEEIKAIRQLVSAVQRAKRLSKPTLQAAQQAEKATGAIEQVLLQIEKLQAATREARHTRDAVAQTWATALAALKRGARAAADDGAATLYAALFDRPGRSNGKASRSKPEPVLPPAPPTPNAA